MDAVMDALSDPSPAQRKSVLASMGHAGELGAANMGYHEQAYGMLSDREMAVQVAAIAALGSMGKYGAMYADALVAKLTSSSEKEVKKAAIQALGNLGDHASAFSGAIETCLDDKDLDLVTEACIALGGMKVLSAAEKVGSKLASPDTEVVIGACIGLGAMGVADEALAGMLGNPTARVRAAALGAMPKAAAEKYIGPACGLLADPDVYVRLNAMKLITGQGEKAAPYLGAINPHLWHASVGVRVAAAAAIGGIGPYAESQVESLEAILADKEEDIESFPMSVAGVRAKVAAAMRKPACAAAAALGAIGSEKAERSVPKLADGLQSTDFEVKIACATALGKLGLPAAKFEDQLVALLEDPHPLVKAAACTAIGGIAESTGTPSINACSKMAEMIKDTHPAVRGAVLGALGSMGEEATAYLEDFVKSFQDTVGYVRAQAVIAVSACGDLGQMYASEICRMMFDEEVRVRLAAVKALPKMGIRGAAFGEEVSYLLEDPVPEVRVAAIRTFGAFGGETLNNFTANIMQAADMDTYPEVKAAAQEVTGGPKALEE